MSTYAQRSWVSNESDEPLKLRIRMPGITIPAPKPKPKSNQPYAPLNMNFSPSHKCSQNFVQEYW